MWNQALSSQDNHSSKVDCYHKADFDSLKEELRQAKEDFINMAEISSAEQLWAKFRTLTTELMRKYIPTRLIKGNKLKKPWIDKKVKSLIRQRQKLFQHMRKTRNETDVRKYRECKQILQKSERQSYWSYVNNIIEVGDQDSACQPKQKRFWSYIKSRVRATDPHCRKKRRNNKFGAKNMNLATTIGERKIAGENFCLAFDISSGLKSLPRAA